MSATGTEDTRVNNECDRQSNLWELLQHQHGWREQIWVPILGNAPRWRKVIDSEGKKPSLCNTGIEIQGG